MLATTATAFAGVFQQQENGCYCVFEAGEAIPLKIKLNSRLFEFDETVELRFKQVTHFKVTRPKGIFVSANGTDWLPLKTFLSPTGYAGGFGCADDGEIEADYELLYPDRSN